ncbi:MAG: site-specific integrase [Sedimentisphaerales bacterium]|nr:site-specific integrase [Sedimentisphaerales bacterium]
MFAEGLSENTVRRRCGIAKQFFKVALKRDLVSSNPFVDLTSTVKGNAKRFYFLTPQEASRVLEACPDTQWRLIFALSRFGGLRCPSEHLALRWEDVDWDRGRMLVRSPKTEHHEGGESRQVPLFPELLPYLRDAFEEAEAGTVYVITKYRDRNCNLRTQLLRIIRKAGLKPWPKLFQNLRATRQTELCERWPEHVVCAWIGNSRSVARKHYLQVTDEHFERAALPTGSPEAAQNAAQHMHEQSRMDSLAVTESAKFDEKRRYARQCGSGMGDTGLEPVTSRV